MVLSFKQKKSQKLLQLKQNVRQPHRIVQVSIRTYLIQNQMYPPKIHQYPHFVHQISTKIHQQPHFYLKIPQKILTKISTKIHQNPPKITKISTKIHQNPPKITNVNIVIIYLVGQIV